MQAISVIQLRYYINSTIWLLIFCQYRWLQYIVLVVFFFGIATLTGIFGVCQKLLVFFGVKNQGHK